MNLEWEVSQVEIWPFSYKSKAVLRPDYNQRKCSISILKQNLPDHGCPLQDALFSNQQEISILKNYTRDENDEGKITHRISSSGIAYSV